MNIILISREELNNQPEGDIVLEDYRAEHIVKVLRSDEGDTVRVGIIDGGRGVGTIANIKKKYPFAVQLSVGIDEDDVEISPSIDIVLALPRPIMLRRILSQATALGVGQFFLINANRVEKSFWKANLLEEKEYRQHLITGLEQSVATKLPAVQFHNRFKPFVEDFLPTIKSDYDFVIIADPTGLNTFQEVILDSKNSEMSTLETGKVLLFVGPEGGWVDFELEKFKEHGLSICTIGERILKVDTAVVALHARVSALLEMRSTCSST